MAAAVVRASYWTASSTGLTAESGIVYNRANDNLTTTTIPKPTSTGTNFSWTKVLALEVTTTGTTTINNRRIHKAANETAGLELWYRDDATSYQTVALAAADNGSADGATPSGYTSMPTSATQYDNTSVATSVAQRNGDYVSTALGVDSSYAGGAGSAIALPNIIMTYDEF